MAFIGPRPLLPGTVSAMGAGGEKRGKLRPGLTGWARVNGNSLLPAADKLALDLWYVSHRSPAIDVGIVIKTLGVMIAGDRIARSSLERASAGDSARSRCKQPGCAGDHRPNARMELADGDQPTGRF